MSLIKRIVIGLFIGIANTLPGVSGGTVAVVTGAYESLINSISQLTNPKKWLKEGRFILPLFLGALGGIFLFASVIDFFISLYPTQVNFLLLGLIVGSLPVILDEAEGFSFKWQNIALFVAAFAVTFSLLLLSPSSAASEPVTNLSLHSVLLMVAAGFITSSAMVIPGVSGSSLMVLLGLYTTFIRNIKEFNVPLLLVFGIGAISGIVVTTIFIKKALIKWRVSTYHIIFGFVVGSLYGIWPGVPTGGAFASSLLSLFWGLFIASLFSSVKEKLALSRQKVIVLTALFTVITAAVAVTTLSLGSA